MENISPGQIIDEPIRPVNIPRKEKDFQGMLEYKREDEQKLVKNLILGKCPPPGWGSLQLGRLSLKSDFMLFKLRS